MKVFFCLILVFWTFQDSSAQSLVSRPDDPGSFFELNNDMLRFDTPSTSLFLGWQRNVNMLFQTGLDGVSDSFDLHRSDRGLLRSMALAVFTGAELIVNRAFSLTAHDQSHMEAARAIGASEVSLVRSSNGQEMGIGEFFLEAFDFTSEPGLYVYYKVNPTLEEQAYVAGEGLDTNMLIAQGISRKINDGAGHIADLAPYLLNKLWGITYFMETGPSSDAENYLSLLNQQGHGTASRMSVISLNAVSCLLSGGFLGLSKGTFDFVTEGNTAVKPLGLRFEEVSIFWPELTTWLNPQSVSLLVSVDGAWKDVLAVRAGIDFPVVGNTDANPEITLGATARAHWLRVGMELTTRFAGLPFFTGGAELDLNEAVSMGIRGFYGERTTMRELREYPLGPGAVGFLRARF